MKTATRYRSPPLRSVHRAIAGLARVDAVDKETMRTFDVACLTPVDDLAPSEIRTIRETARMSQTTFAKALNVTSSLVSKWERGEKKPSGPSLKLLSLANRKGMAAIL